MRSKVKETLIIAVLLIAGLYFMVIGLVAAKGFLAPLSVAVLLSMVLLTMAGKLEKWGINRGWSAFLSVLVTIALFVGFAYVISGQVSAVTGDWPQIKKKVRPQLEQLQQFISEKTGLEPREQELLLKKQVTEKEPPQSPNQSQNSSNSEEMHPGESSSGLVGDLVFGFFNFSGTALLTFVYIFFMLLYRRKLKKSILKFVPSEQCGMADRLLRDSVKISNSYLVGRILLILILIVLYSIGLSLSGVRHAILVSTLAAILSLLPYIGNILGFFLAIAMAAFSGAGTAAYVGVMITFGVAQFVESYILEPYIVGHKVSLNPLMTILVVVLGGAVWGILGMIISIPVFGIVKIICDQIKILRPVGYMLGEEDILVSEKESLFERMARKLRKH